MFAYRLFHLLLALLCVLYTPLHAYDLDQDPRPRAQLGPLGVTLDYSFARLWPRLEPGTSLGGRVQRSWVFTSHLTFSEPVSSISDGQLWKIAADAYKEIDRDRQYYKVGKPAVGQAMAVIAFGNEIILASSHRGAHVIYDLPVTPVRQALDLCQIVWRDSDQSTDENQNRLHRTTGHCGEIIASHLYFLEHPDVHLKEQGGRVATVVLGIATDPCGNDGPKDTWGCNLFIQSMGLTAVDRNTPKESYDMSTLAGGNPDISQIPLCSNGEVRTKR
ncbi:hypothetical protein BJX61DRAFT_542311 [Aspergillus egyptiacus]|nr:hypothetical protein BJX61DRAFT_542311 [Aspergillus egyptiacus]